MKTIIFISFCWFILINNVYGSSKPPAYAYFNLTEDTSTYNGTTTFTGYVIFGDTVTFINSEEKHLPIGWSLSLQFDSWLFRFNLCHRFRFISASNFGSNRAIDFGLNCATG